MKLVAVDTETSGLFVDDGAEVKVISLCDEKGPRVYILDHPDHEPGSHPLVLDGGQIDALYSWLSKRQLIFHNALFDLQLLNTGSWGMDLQDQFYWDTMLAVRVLDPGKGAALKWYCNEKFGPQSIEAMVELELYLAKAKKKKDKMWTAPLEVLVKYAAADAKLTWDLYHLQLAQLERHENEIEASKLLEREFMTMKCLLRMEKRGVGWDVREAEAAAIILEQRLDHLTKLLPFRPTVPQAVKYFFEDQGYIPTELTAKGKPSIGKAARRTLIEQGAPFAHEYDLYERTKRWVSMWYRGWTDKCGADGRLRPRFRQQGTVSMRLSIERIQLQAIPHDYQMKADLPEGIPTPRELFRAKEGHEIWEIDVSQAEVRIAAAVAKCQRMREIIESGEDIHGATCRELFNYTPEDDEWDKYRNIAKRLNFATVYGAGVRGLQEQIRIHTGITVSENEARNFLNKHRKSFPEFVRTAQAAEERARQRGHVRLCSGMKRWFQPHEELHKAFNQVIQGGVAEGMKDWMALTESSYDNALLLQIHDSLVLELPAETAEQDARRVAETGSRVFEHYFKIPFVADYKRWI